LTEKLDYLRDLGIDGLWLMPIFASPLRDDGYDVADFRQIDPTAWHCRRLPESNSAAHDRGIRTLPTW